MKVNDNDYLLNGEKVKLFSRDKTRDILLFERSENNNSSRVLSSEKTLFRHLIRNFIFCTSLFAHKHYLKPSQTLSQTSNYQTTTTISKSKPWHKVKIREIKSLFHGLATFFHGFHRNSEKK